MGGTGVANKLNLKHTSGSIEAAVLKLKRGSAAKNYLEETAIFHN